MVKHKISINFGYLIAVFLVVISLCLSNVSLAQNEQSTESVNDKGTLIVIARSVIGADIYIDEQIVGKTPWKGELDSGYRYLKVTAQGYEQHIEKVLVVANKETRVEIDLVKTAILSVDVGVEDAEVYVDGTSIGIAPVVEAELPQGQHEVVIRKQGYLDIRHSVDLKPGEKEEVKEEMRPIAETKKNKYTQLRAILGFGGKSIETVEPYGSGSSYKWNTEPSPVRMGASFQGFKLYGPYFGAGIQIPFFFAGYNSDLFVDLSPEFRFRKATVRDGRDFVEFYVQLGGGFTAYFPHSTKAAAQNVTTEKSKFLIGWNLGIVGGVQINFTDILGVFADFGWQIHKVYGKLDDIDSQIEVMRHEPIVSIGLAFGVL